MNPLGQIKDLLRFHKLKIVATLVMAIVIAVLIFPFDDLSDIVSTQISQLSNGTWYVQFDGLGLDILPALGITMADVSIEGQNLPPIKADKFSVSPWLIGALTAKQGASADVEGLFGGALAADYREGEKTKSGDHEKDVDVDAKNIQLVKLTSFLRDGGLLSVALGGLLNISTQVKLDPLFDTQPQAAIDMQIADFTIPGQTFHLNFNGMPMPIPLPEVKFGETKVGATVKEGQINLEDVTFGSPTATLAGKIKGQVALSLRRDKFGVQPILGLYNLNIDLTIKREFLDANEAAGIGIALGFVKQFRRDTPTGVRYAFRMKGSPNSGLPEFSAPAP